MTLLGRQSKFHPLMPRKILAQGSCTTRRWRIWPKSPFLFLFSFLSPSCLRLVWCRIWNASVLQRTTVRTVPFWPGMCLMHKRGGLKIRISPDGKRVSNGTSPLWRPIIGYFGHWLGTVWRSFKELERRVASSAVPTTVCFQDTQGASLYLGGDLSGQAPIQIPTGACLTEPMMDSTWIATVHCVLNYNIFLAPCDF